MTTSKTKKIKVVTIGGGTGSFTLLTELKEMPHVEVTAVVAMSDSGGSTGRLRVSMGVLPAGDVRQALVALARSPEDLRELFTYRYEAGTIAGHTFGNLFLSTIEKITGSLEEAIIRAGKLLNVKGRIYPVTLTKHDLVVEMPNGERVIGEGTIDERYISGYTSISLTDNPVLNPRVARAIADADIVIIAPGNFYCSIVPNLLVPGLTQSLQETSAKVVMVANLTTKEGHTRGFDVAEFISEMKVLFDGFTPDAVVYNTEYNASATAQALYAAEGGRLVALGDVSEFHDIEFISGKFIADIVPQAQSSADTVKRSLLRHDAKKVLALIGIELTH